MTKKHGSFTVVDLVEQEDGSAILTLDVDKEHLSFIYQIGLTFVLFCSCSPMTVDEAFLYLAEKAKQERE